MIALRKRIRIDSTAAGVWAQLAKVEPKARGLELPPADVLGGAGAWGSVGKFVSDSTALRDALVYATLNLGSTMRACHARPTARQDSG